MAQLSLNIFRGFLSNSGCWLPWVIRPNVFWKADNNELSDVTNLCWFRWQRTYRNKYVKTWFLLQKTAEPFKLHLNFLNGPHKSTFLCFVKCCKFKFKLYFSCFLSLTWDRMETDNYSKLFSSHWWLWGRSNSGNVSKLARSKSQMPATCFTTPGSDSPNYVSLSCFDLSHQSAQCDWLRIGFKSTLNFQNEKGK